MSSDPWMDLVASSGHLALAVLIAAASGPRVLRWPLVALCLDMFGWNFAVFAFETTNRATWHYLDLLLSPLVLPIGLHSVVAFAGRLRTMRRWVRVAYGCGIALSFPSGLAPFFAGCARWVDTPAWALSFLVLLIAVAAVNISILVSHLRAHRDREERARAWLMLGAAVAGSVVGSSELMKGFVPGLPGMGALGSLLITLPTAIAFLRYGLFTHPHPWKIAISITALSALLVVVCAAAFTGLGGALSVGIFAAGLVGTPIVWALRRLAVDLVARRERARDLAQAGRMVEQVAHDLRNPTASLKAAIQYIQAEQEGGGLAPATLRTYLGLMHGQVERIASVIEGYLRLARVVPTKTEVDVNAVAQSCAARHGERISTDLGHALPPVWFDPDLLAAALDNLVTNALDASEPSQPIAIKTTVHSQAGGEVIEVSVEDHGCGMDPRHLQLVFQEFFTTKPSGTGLGLSFVQRILEAHGGSVVLTSTLGSGTTAVLRIPVSTS